MKASEMDYVEATVEAVRNNMDLSPRQIAILGVADAPKRWLGEKPCELGRVAACLNFSPPAVVRAADRLNELGLMERVTMAHDRRRVILTTTADGRAVLEALRSGKWDGARNVFMGVT